MVTLKCSKFMSFGLSLGTELDMQVRQYEDEPRMIYLGQSSNVIQFPEDDIDIIYQLFKQAKELKLNEERKGWLK